MSSCILDLVERHLVCPSGIRSGVLLWTARTGEYCKVREAESGLFELILWSGIRACVGEIYPYVRREDRAGGGYQLPGMQGLCALEVPNLSYFIRSSCRNLIEFGLSCSCWTDLQGFLRSDLLSLQHNNVRSLACVFPPLLTPTPDWTSQKVLKQEYLTERRQVEGFNNRKSFPLWKPKTAPPTRNVLIDALLNPWPNATQQRRGEGNQRLCRREPYIGSFCWNLLFLLYSRGEFHTLHIPLPCLEMQALH